MNFVDIVGYQFEKVHTGVLAWLLDSRRSPLPLDEQIVVVRNLAPDLPILGEPLSVRAIREYSFGRRRRIDLVLEIISNDGAKVYLLIECKVDTDVNFTQLENSASCE